MKCLLGEEHDAETKRIHEELSLYTAGKVDDAKGKSDPMLAENNASMHAEAERTYSD
jgi:hypothetical protein